VGDPVDLAAPAPAGSPGPPAGGLAARLVAALAPERGQLAGQGAAHRRGRQRRIGAGRDGLDVARPLEPAERRIQRAERDGEVHAEQVGQPLAQLVAVEVVVVEEAEDGELDHRGSGSLWTGGWPAGESYRSAALLV